MIYSLVQWIAPIAWEPKYLRDLGFTSLVSSDDARGDEMVVEVENVGRLWDDAVAWVVEDKAWLTFDSSDKTKAQEKIRSVYYIAPGATEESPIKNLIMQQGTNFKAKWQNSIDKGILEENAVLKYLTRRGKLVRVGQTLYVKEIQSTNTCEVVFKSDLPSGSAGCAPQCNGRAEGGEASITVATGSIGISNHANAAGGGREGEGDNATDGHSTIHNMKECEKSNKVGVLLGCGRPRELKDVGMPRARGRPPQSRERRGLNDALVAKTCQHCHKDFAPWDKTPNTKQALITNHYKSCAPNALDTDHRSALETQHQSNEGSQQVLDSNVGLSIDMSIDDFPSASDLADNSNKDKGLQSGKAPSGDVDAKDDDGGDGGDGGDDGGGDNGDDRRHHFSNDNGASYGAASIVDGAANNYDLVRLRVLVQDDKRKELPVADVLKLWGCCKEEKDLLTREVPVFLGKSYEITAEALMLPGAKFEDLSQSIGNNHAISENGQALFVFFKDHVRNEDLRVLVKMRISAAAEVCSFAIVFKVTAPLRYACPERTLLPGRQTIVFNLEVQPPNCEALSQTRMGGFSIISNDLPESFESNLDSRSGKLTLGLPKALNLFKRRMSQEDSNERTFELLIEQKNQFGEITIIVVFVEPVKFMFKNIPVEMIKGQSISGVISLTSVPDILTQLQVSITDLGSLPGGFEICDSRLEIAGAPNVESDAKVHAVTISCKGLAGIPVNLALPQVKIREPPLLQKLDPGRVTTFSLDEKLLAMKGAAKDFQFEENLMDAEHKKLFTMGSEGCSAQLTLVMKVQTVVQIDYASDTSSKLCALKNVNVEIRQIDHVKKEWVLQKDVMDFRITVKDGNLLIHGEPKAYTDEKDLLIDKSAQRCRIFTVKITPQNQAGNGKIFSLTIICQPLRIFFAVAQTYDSIKTRTNDKLKINTLKCCKVDLKKMIEVQHLLGCDIFLTSCDATRGQIDCQIRDLHTLALSATLDLLVLFTGHGQQRVQVSDDVKTNKLLKTDMLLRHEDFSAEWESVPHNLCIEDFAERILEFTDNSSFPVVLADICRVNSESDTKGHPHANLNFNLTFKSLMKQIVIWWSTSAGLSAMAAEPGQDVMSMWTGFVVQVLLELHEGKLQDLLLTQGQFHQYVPGISVAVKARVHRLVLKRVQDECETFNAESQAPEHRDFKVREAFSFQSPSLLLLHADLCAPMLIDLRWKRLLEDKLLVEGDCIVYVDDQGGELIGYVQGDGSIKHTSRSKHTSYPDAVAFATDDNMWMSLDRHHQGAIDTNAKLFACCHLRDRDNKLEMVSLAVLSTRCAPASADGAQGIHHPGKGKENDHPQQPDNPKIDKNSDGALIASSRKRQRESSSHAYSKQPKVK